MRALVLVDLDNVGKWLPDAIERHMVRKGPGARADDVVVVLGLNCFTAKTCANNGLASWDQFEKLARRIAAWLEGPVDVTSIEIALVMTAPEAVDKALLDLLQFAGSTNGIVEVQRIWLISKDKGIRKEIEANTRTKKKYWTVLKETTKEGKGSLSPADKKSLLCAWDVGTLRRVPYVVSIPEENPTDPALSPSVFIDTDGLAAWAGEQRVQVEGTIDRVAVRVDREPSLLTQVGLTRWAGRTVTAGLSRLEQGLRGEAGLLGPCGSEDGLEVSLLRDFKGATMSVEKVEPSPLGPGAVRLRGTIGRGSSCLTARTRLPRFLVDKAFSNKKSLHVRWNAFLDDTGLISLAGRSGPGQPGVEQTAHFVRDRNGARCKVEMNDEGGWWCLVRGHPDNSGNFMQARSWLVLPAPLDGWLPRGRFSVSCTSRVARLRSGLSAVMSSTLGEGDEVRVIGRLDGKTERIGEALSADGAIPCALLFGGEPLDPGASMACMPVQSADIYKLMRWLDISDSMADVLRAMPLVVPDCESLRPEGQGG